jgi:hypothetical protein
MTNGYCGLRKSFGTWPLRKQASNPKPLLSAACDSAILRRRSDLGLRGILREQK